MRYFPTTRTSGSAQVIITFALIFALLLFWLLCAVVDLDTDFEASTLAQAAAQTAVTSGANDINPSYLFSGQPSQVLDPSATAVCEQAGNYSLQIPASHPPHEGTSCSQGTCTVAAVTAIVVHYPLPLPLLSPTAVVEGEFQAGVASGTATAQAHLVCGTIAYPPPP